MGSGWMSPQVILGVIGLVVVAIASPWIRKRFFDAAHKLRVTIEVSPCLERGVLVTLLKEERKKAAKEAALNKEVAVDEVFYLDRVRSYITVTIRNTGNKKVDGVVLRIVSVFGAFDKGQYQLDDDNATQKVQKDGIIQIGDLRPQDQRLLHFWSEDRPLMGVSDLKKRFVVSADQLDLLSYRFPLPSYILNRWEVYVAQGLFISGHIFCSDVPFGLGRNECILVASLNRENEMDNEKMNDIKARLTRQLPLTKKWKFHNFKEENYNYRSPYLAHYAADLVELPDGTQIYGWSYKKGRVEAAKVLLPGGRVLEPAFLDADEKWWVGIHPDHIADEIERLLRAPDDVGWRYSHHQMFEALETVATWILWSRPDMERIYMKLVMKDCLGKIIK
jgi:hypothetical protein